MVASAIAGGGLFSLPKVPLIKERQIMQVGNKIKNNLVPEVSSQLKNLLPLGEEIIGIFSVIDVKTPVVAIVITNARILGVAKELSAGDWGWKYLKEMRGDDIKTCSAGSSPMSSFGHHLLKIHTADDKIHKYAQIRKNESVEILKLLESVSGSPEPLSSIIEKRRAAVAQKQNTEVKPHNQTNVKSDTQTTPRVDPWAAIIKGKVNKTALREVQQSCHSGEMPEFILGDGINGVLAAFNDRCMVIKKGLGTSLMSSSFGGGRVATFAYRDITGIEYNSGIMTGVLEILTASYTGKTTNSPWQFGNEKSAHESSNTLPWGKIFYNQVRSEIEWMQQKIHEAKATGGQMIAQVSNSDELSKLAALHKQGVLTDKEFAEAKQKILGKL